jgi:DNA (cytosine-5)-methyltransferase 1
MMRVLDLFSGIGGFSLGLERTGGFKTVAFCEIEPFCQRVLAKHWPEVPIYDDIRELTGARLAADGIAVDVICGGFPCQDISNAGVKEGIQGVKSGLWSEYLRLVGDLRPRFVIVENVGALLYRGLETVLGDLATVGFDAEWDCIPASYVGAPHIRDRVWITAYPHDHGQPTRAIHDETPRLQAARGIHWPDHGEFLRMDDGLSETMDARIRALGNAVVPQIPELIGKAILEAEGGC